MRPRHDQSSISARLDGNLTVGAYIRRHWLRDFQKTLDRCDIRSNSARLPRNHSVFLRRHFAAPINSLFTAHLVRFGSETQLTFAARLTAKSSPYNNSPDRGVGLQTAAQILTVRPRHNVWSRCGFGCEGQSSGNKSS